MKELKDHLGDNIYISLYGDGLIISRDDGDNSLQYEIYLGKKVYKNLLKFIILHKLLQDEEKTD